MSAHRLQVQSRFPTARFEDGRVLAPHPVKNAEYILSGNARGRLPEESAWLIAAALVQRLCLDCDHEPCMCLEADPCEK